MAGTGNGPAVKKKMIRVIGIDFGTSSTYMYVKRYNPDNLMENSFNYIAVSFNHGESVGYLPSVIRENSDASFDFGRTANEAVEGASIHRNFKMKLESSDSEERAHARLLTEKLFEHLYSNYRQQLSQMGDPSDEVETIISYPVKWLDETIDFMVQAAKKAGFPNVRGMDEATAAISTVITQNFHQMCANDMLSPDKEKYLLLVDMGAGTTDLVLCRYHFENPDGGEITADKLRIETVTNWPTDENAPTFGGREIDEKLTEYVEEYLRRALPAGLSSMASAITRTGNSVKLWKENHVSSTLNKNQPVTSCGFIRAYLMQAQEKFPPITRESFEQMIEDKLQDYTALLSGCLDAAASADADFAENGLNIVILTGGHSSWYFAKEIIDGTDKNRFYHPSLAKIYDNKSRVFSMPNPQSTVALGLIYNRMMSSLRLQKQKAAKVHDSNWIRYLYNPPLYPAFQNAAVNSDREIFKAAESFTRSYRFHLDADAFRYVSVCRSNPYVDNIYRFKKFFGGKDKDICFGEISSFLDNPDGIAVCVCGVYFESFLTKGCFSWKNFIKEEIRPVGHNKDKVAIQLITDKFHYDQRLPLRRESRAVIFEYLRNLQFYLRSLYPPRYPNPPVQQALPQNGYQQR